MPIISRIATLHYLAARGIVLVGPNNPIKALVIVICWQPFGITSPPSLSLEVLQRDIPPLRISRVTSWVRRVRLVSSEPVL